MSDEITVDGVVYISSKRASQSSGYAQDYIGQLARRALIEARRIGNLWYVSMDSLNAYKENAVAYVPQPPEYDRVAKPEAFLSFDGKDYVSASRASEITGYHQDYIGQLARAGTVLSRQVGNHWYVDREGIVAHKKEKDGLLAAVQAESVGIPRPEAPERLQDDAGNYLTYTSDDRDLLPVPAHSNVESELQEEENTREIESDTEHRVPIRVIKEAPAYPIRKSDSPGVVYTPHSQDKKIQAPRMTNRSVIFSASIAAVLIVVVSVGLVSLRGSSSYVNSMDQVTKTAFMASVAQSIDGIGSILERFIVPELVYRRSAENS